MPFSVLPKQFLAGFALFAGLATFPLRAEDAPSTAEADRAWAALTEPLDGLTPETASTKLGDTPTNYAWQERWNRRYRDRGLAFWSAYPGDPRRYDWFATASKSYVHYWSNPVEGGWFDRYHHWTTTPRSVAIDRAAESEWELRYTAMLPEFLRNTDPVKYDHDFFQLSLYHWRSLHQEEAYCRGDPVDVPGLVAEWERHVRLNDFHLVERHLAYLYKLALWNTAIQENPTARSTTLSIMRASQIPEIMKLADGQMQSEANKGPLEGQYRSLVDDRVVDLASLRGQVILVDYYGLYCSTCWQQMSIWRELYKKYHASGLNILCIALLHGSKDEAKLILQKQKDRGVDWPEAQLMIPPEEKDATLARFGETGVPFHMLLDTEGNVVPIRTSPDGWSLERAIRQALKLPPLKPGEETRPPEWPSFDRPPRDQKN